MTAQIPAIPAAAAPHATTTRLAKYHGLGNDFLVALSPPQPPGPADARRWCDRRRGVGADGLIVGETGGPSETPFSFLLFNADGSEPEMSGNGMRCLAHALLDAGLVEVGRPFGVQTPGGRREVLIERAEPGADGSPEIWASVDMGVARIEGDADRCNIGHGQLLVDVGNPHLVVTGPDPATVDVATLGARLATSDPAGRNVEFVTLGPGPGEVTMRVFERGVGETAACGTGACAAALAFYHWGRVGPAVTVHQPGGAAAVTIGPGSAVRLAGPSVAVARGITVAPAPAPAPAPVPARVGRAAPGGEP